MAQTRQKRKQSNQYYFSVEGQTEKWYLEWLGRQINSCANAKEKVSFYVKVEKSPTKFAKAVNIRGKTVIYHLCDVESAAQTDLQQFNHMIDDLNKAMELGRQITYELEYSNLTFDLWMILHKMDSSGSATDKRQYLTRINKAYHTTFQSLDEYKKELCFRQCLDQLTLNDVQIAIGRARKIMENNKTNGARYTSYGGQGYYIDNPALKVWEIIAKILQDCGL